MRVLVALTVAVGVAGCFNPTYQNPECSPLGECPDGLMCGPENICVAAPGDLDASLIDSTIDAPDGMAADANTSICDVHEQVTCPDGWKCSAVMEQGGKVQAHCVPDGAIGVDGFCEPYILEEELTGYRYDDCRRGSLCANNVCKAFCNVSQGPDACGGPTYVCVNYAILPNDPELGLCDPTCDPVSQIRLSDGQSWCGSTNTVQPERTCVGQPNGPFFCANTVDVNALHGTLINPPYLNGCAAGFMPYMPDPNMSGGAICAAMCRPQETSMVMPAGAQGQPGSGYTCPDRGAFNAECRFVSMIQDMSQPGFGDHDEVGFCLDYQNYPGMDSCTVAITDPQSNGCYPY